MISSKQKCLLLTGVSTVINVPLHFRQRGPFLATISMACINIGLATSNVKLFFPNGKREGMVYQQKVGNPVSTNCAPFIADLFLIIMRGLYCLIFTNINRTTL